MARVLRHRWIITMDREDKRPSAKSGWVGFWLNILHVGDEVTSVVGAEEAASNVGGFGRWFDEDGRSVPQLQVYG